MESSGAMTKLHALSVFWWCLCLAHGQQQGPLRPCSQLLSHESKNAQQGVWLFNLNLPVSKAVVRWQATIKFSRPVTEFVSNKGTHTTADMRVFVLRASTRETTAANTTLQINMEVKYSGSINDLFIESIHFDGPLVCNVAAVGASTPAYQPLSSTASSSQADQKRLKYDYSTVITNSHLFYEAQRSGLLPADNRIAWRNDSCVNDRGARNEDLSGGYYTNGRTLKFTFPTAASMTVLAWGILNHEDGYTRAKELEFAKDALYWGASYLERCHTKQDELYALVGNVTQETTEWWGRPEDINFPRPAYAITTANPGSELAAETAAALAASSIIFNDHNKQTMLNHAKQLFNFAINYRGDYTKAVPQVSNFYKSWSGDEDELVWAALWLYRATDQQDYLKRAKDMYKSFRLSDRRPNEFSWDEKTLGVRILLASYTLEDTYEREAESVCNLLIFNTTLRTPQGLFHIGQPVGSVRYASNLAFACYELGEVLIVNRGIAVNPYLDFAVRQVNAILGDGGRSYMVGFGNNPPQRVQHAAASCPNIPLECGWKNKNLQTPNPHVVVGALVGGPSQWGVFDDNRDNYQQNDVGIDYNAGFQSLVAALISLHHQRQLPTIAYETSSAYGRYQ